MLAKIVSTPCRGRGRTSEFRYPSVVTRVGAAGKLEAGASRRSLHSSQAFKCARDKGCGAARGRPAQTGPLELLGGATDGASARQASLLRKLSVVFLVLFFNFVVVYLGECLSCIVPAVTFATKNFAL